MGRSIVELLSPEEIKPTVYQNPATINRDGHWEGEFNVKREDGSTIPVHIINSLLRGGDGESVGNIGIGSDLPDRKRMEQQLQQSSAIGVKWRSPE